jgi:hypothetical protein
MHSTLAPKDTDPHDIFVIEPDVVLAARADKTSPNPAHDGRPSAPQDHTTPDVFAGMSAPSVDATFRAAAVDNIKVPSDRLAIGSWPRRALMGFLFALCSAVAAAGWAHYGDAAKAMAVSWAPKYVLTSSPPQENPGVAEQPSSPILQADAADQAAAQPAPPAQPAQGVAPSVAAPPQESAQLLQSMSQQIEQLKASIEQLKTNQEQMSRDIARNSATRTALARTSEAKTSEAKTSEARTSEARTSEARTSEARTSEPNLRPRIPAPPLRSAAAPARKPMPTFAPAQAAAAPTLPQAAAAAPVVPLQPGPPAQATAQPDVEPVVRPPMPVR